MTNNILFSIFEQRAYVYIRNAGWLYRFSCIVLAGPPADCPFFHVVFYPDRWLTVHCYKKFISRPPADGSQRIKLNVLWNVKIQHWQTITYDVPCTTQTLSIETSLLQRLQFLCLAWNSLPKMQRLVSKMASFKVKSFTNINFHWQPWLVIMLMYQLCNYNVKHSWKCFAIHATVSYCYYEKLWHCHVLQWKYCM